MIMQPSNIIALLSTDYVAWCAIWRSHNLTSCQQTFMENNAFVFNRSDHPYSRSCTKVFLPPNYACQIRSVWYGGCKVLTFSGAYGSIYSWYIIVKYGRDGNKVHITPVKFRNFGFKGNSSSCRVVTTEDVCEYVRTWRWHNVVLQICLKTKYVLFNCLSVICETIKVV